jgi:multidrug efflux pump subunit AcrA (membrane-fusion protein)
LLSTLSALPFIARTEAVPTVEVRARVAGILEDVLFKEGMDVKKGQPLFIIQQAEYKAALETARAMLAKAQADLTRARDTSIVERVKAQLAQRQADLEKARQDVNRYKPLAEARAIPQQDMDTSVAAEKVAAAGVDAQVAAVKDAELAQRTQIQLSEAAVESAKASIIQADLNYGYTTIAAPIDGIIGKINVDRGNLVGKSDPTLLATVSKVNPIYVDFSVAEADYIRLAPRISADVQGRSDRPRQPLELLLSDDKPLPQKGRVVFVDRAMDNKTGTIGIRVFFSTDAQMTVRQILEAGLKLLAVGPLIQAQAHELTVTLPVKAWMAPGPIVPAPLRAPLTTKEPPETVTSREFAPDTVMLKVITPVLAGVKLMRESPVPKPVLSICRKLPKPPPVAFMF